MKIPEVKYLIIDNCHTIVNFPAAREFIFFTLRFFRSKKIIIANILDLLNKIPYFFSFLKITFKVEYQLSLLILLKGLTTKQLELSGKEYYDKVISENYNSNVLDFVKVFKKENKNLTILIVSGGYDFYLKYIKKNINADYLVCTELKFNNDVFTGDVIGQECTGPYKVLKLNKKGLLENLAFNETAVVSDSYSDLPLFSLGRYKFVTNPDKNLKVLIGSGYEEIK